jgi:ferredoxin-NADP reductase
MAIRGANSVSAMTEAPNSPPVDTQWQTGVVQRVLERTSRIKSFFIKPKTPFAFIAGQHADLRLTADNGYSTMRSYSIASAPLDAHDGFELAIERLDDGEVSPFFHDIVAIGDEIEVRAPLGGHFVWSPQDGGPLILIGGGSGLVPLMSMIRQRRAEGSSIPCALILSARRWDDVLFRDELIALHDVGDGFNLVMALTRDAPRRSGDFDRRIDAEIVGQVARALPAPAKYTYICGANPFVNVASDGALAAGVPADIIRTERYGA